MKNHQLPKKFKPPWGENRIGKYSIEEIALEFILWEDAGPRDDATRRDFVQQALEQNFGAKDPVHALRRFGETYERLYEKIYHRKPDTNFMDPTPEVQGFFDPRIKKKAA